MRGIIARALDRLETLRARWIAESPPQMPDPAPPPLVQLVGVPQHDLQRWMMALSMVRAAFGPPEHYSPGSSRRDALADAWRTYIDIRDVLLLDSIRSSLDDPGEKRA